MSPSVRLGLIGCGAIAKTHLDAIKRVPRIKLYTICDARPDVAQAAALAHHCRSSVNAADVLDDPLIDAVIICVPPVYHYEILKKAIRTGKHVLCEKPFTVQLSQALEIKKLCQRSQKTMQMASKFRFVRDVIQAKKYAEAVVVGLVVMCEVIFCSIVNMASRWNSDPKISGGGVLIDNGSHAVDVIRYLAGPIKSLYAQVGRKIKDLKVEDTARLHFETNDGVIGMVDLSWLLYKNTDSFLNIFGTHGTIEVGWTKSVVWNSKEKTSKVFGGGYNKLDAFTSELEHFVDCIQKKTKPILTIDDAVESVRVIETAYASIKKSRWLKLKNR